MRQQSATPHPPLKRAALSAPRRARRAHSPVSPHGWRPSRPPGWTRRRLTRVLVVSALLHFLLIALFLVSRAPPELPEPAPDQPVTMLFEAGAPQAKVPGKTRAEAAKPAPAPAALPTPSAPDLPPPAPEASATPLPEPPVPPPAPMPAPEAAAPPPVPSPPATAALAPSPQAAPLPPLPPDLAPSPEPPPTQARRPTTAAPARPSARSNLPPVLRYSFGGPSRPSSSPAPRRSGSTGAIDFALGPIARNSVGAPPADPGSPDLDVQVRGAHVGADWLAELHAWWARHGYYPPEAGRAGEDGTVRVRLEVDRSGQVRSVDMLQRSGSKFLDMGALSVFRDAMLPAFPVNTPEAHAELDITINYILIRR